MSFTAGIALALAAVLGGSHAPMPATVLPQAQTVKQYVSHYFADEPVMIAIAQCESHFHQYAADGSVYRGEVNHLDVGVMQINEHYHGATAKALGVDLYTIQGNVAYAQYLYEREGTAPWNSSKPCWGRSPAAQAQQNTSGGTKVALALGRSI